MSTTFRHILSKGLPPSGSMMSSRRMQQNRDFTPLRWDEFFDEKRTISFDGNLFNVYLKGSSGPLFYLLHGGGYSGLTWACLVMEVSSRINCRILAPDLRGHGDTVTNNDNDLSTERQVQDIIEVFNGVYGNKEEVPVVCIIGHSMGGALAVHAVNSCLIPNIVGLVVIDVVEGSAMESLSGMADFLRNRPDMFESEEKAVIWSVQNGTAKSLKAARVSMPSQIRKGENGKLVWRINLANTEPHWAGWFQGLSQAFLQCAPPKLLVLAGIDRLDKELIIGQMQGKFQTVVFPRVGHVVQEDSPDQLADELARFAVRFRFAEVKSGSHNMFKMRV